MWNVIYSACAIFAEEGYSDLPLRGRVLGSTKHNSVVGTFPAEWSDEPAFSTLHGLRKTSGNSGEVFHDQGGREIDNEVTRNG